MVIKQIIEQFYNIYVEKFLQVLWFSWAFAVKYIRPCFSFLSFPEYSFIAFPGCNFCPSVIVTRIVSCKKETRMKADGMWNIFSCYGLRKTLKSFINWIPSSLMLRLNQVVYNKLEVISKLPINPVWEDLQWTSREWANFLAHNWWGSVV